MAKIAYILLCHKDADGIIAQANRLTAAGDAVAIHFDARSPAADYARIRAALSGNPGVAFARRRVRCGWGEWSLVAATLNAIEVALEAFADATHLYMLSGDCMSIKSAEYARAFLDSADVDYIESFDFFASDWIRTGIKEERLIYRHYVNERSRKRLFYGLLEAQRRLGLRRAIPADLQVMIGSQWWCLRRRTVEAVMDFLCARPDLRRFFATTWIPDETCFQTLVRHLVPEGEIRARTLTFLMFTDYGMPVTFHDDHYNLLLTQDYLFARKISQDAVGLRARLGALYAQEGMHFPISNEGRSLFRFLTERGRVGRRFAPRFWETEAGMGRERTLLIVTCKKWHIAKRLVDRAREVAGIAGVHFLFNEAGTPLPDLGGIQTTLEKRTRHRRALLRMLFDTWETDRLMVCIDPANVDLMLDLCGDRGDVRLLEIACRFSDAYLIGHARRVGLASEETPDGVLDRILPTIRADFRFESDRLHDAGFASFHRLREDASVADNAGVLERFLGVDPNEARTIAGTHYLFTD